MARTEKTPFTEIYAVVTVRGDIDDAATGQAVREGLALHFEFLASEVRKGSWSGGSYGDDDDTLPAEIDADLVTPATRRRWADE